MTPKFAIGDRVQKASDYRFPGIVRSVYTTGAGETRYDVEADHPDFSGMLHIFSEAQLVPRETSTNLCNYDDEPVSKCKVDRCRRHMQGGNHDAERGR